MLAAGARPHHSLLGIVWLALTAAAMFALATGKRDRSRPLEPCPADRSTGTDGLLATAVLVGLLLNATLGWWCADPAAAFAIVYYDLHEGWQALHETVR